jgi:hypothetical protein
MRGDLPDLSKLSPEDRKAIQDWRWDQAKVRIGQVLVILGLVVALLVPVLAPQWVNYKAAAVVGAVMIGGSLLVHRTHASKESRK